MDQLPVEVLENIFSYLDDFSKFSCNFVCKKWSEVIDFYGQIEKPTSLKVQFNSLKLYTDTTFLRTINCPEGTFREMASNHVFPIIGPNLTKINVINIQDCKISELLLKIPSPVDPKQQIPALTRLFLDAVDISGRDFVAVCAKFGPSLANFYISTRLRAFKGFNVSSPVDNGQMNENESVEQMEADNSGAKLDSKEGELDNSALLEGIKFLVNIEHLNFNDLRLENKISDGQNLSSENGDIKPTSCLIVIAQFCPKLKSLAVSDALNVTSECVNALLKSENSRNLANLCLTHCKIDDQIEEGLDYRASVDPQAADLTVYIGNTIISSTLIRKYSPFHSNKVTLDDQVPMIYSNMSGPDYLFYDERYLTDWPSSDTAPASDDEDLDSSISGGGHRIFDHHDYDDFDDGDDFDDYYDDDDDLYEGDDDFYG